MNLPWLNYLLVNAPDEYYGGYSWYDFIGEITPGVQRSRELLFELLELFLETLHLPAESLDFLFQVGHSFAGA